MVLRDYHCTYCDKKFPVVIMEDYSAEEHPEYPCSCGSKASLLPKKPPHPYNAGEPEEQLEIFKTEDLT